MGSFRQDIRYGLRVLGKSPGFTALAVLTLALGIGVNTVVFGLVKAVLLHPVGYRQPDHLVCVAETTPDAPDNPSVDSFTARDWQGQSRSFESMAAYFDGSAVLLQNGRANTVRGLRISYNFFDTLGVSMQLGRAFLPEEDRPDRRATVIILSHGTWIRRFGADPNILGRVLQVSGSDCTVVGVLPANFPAFLHGTTELLPEIYLPIGYDFSSDCRTCDRFRVIARLKPGVAVNEARAELNTIMRNIAREHPADYVQTPMVSVTPVGDYVFGRVRNPLWVVFGAACFVLMIACANVASLCLARATGRTKEMALRAALGASRLDLIRQLLTESLILALAGGVVGLLIAFLGTGPLVSVLPSQLPRINEIHTDGAVLLFTLGSSLLTAILCGVAPAWRISRVDLNEVLKDSTNPSDSHTRRNLRDALVVGELALAFILSVGAGLMVKSFKHLTEVDPGYDPRNILTLTTDVWGARYQDHPQAATDYYEQALSHVRATPGVELAALTSALPLDYSVRERFHVKGRALATGADAPLVDSYSVSTDYFRVMKIPLKLGRFFENNDTVDSAKVALISESCARNEFPHEDPIGKQIQLKGDEHTTDWATVVGVVGDVRQYALDRAPEMAVYLSEEQVVAINYYRLVARTTFDPHLTERSVEDAFLSVDANLPVYHTKTLEEYLSGTLAPRTVALLLLKLFSTLAMVLAAVGVYGLVSYAVGLRGREIGIRIALGAAQRQILTAVLRQGLVLAVAGIAIGFGISLMLTRLLGSLLFEVSPRDLPTCVIVGLVLTSIALTACYLPARRAATIDPMGALRDQ
jgi:putative ABC transport system permease protein